jgi:hypothetical protein
MVVRDRLTELQENDWSAVMATAIFMLFWGGCIHPAMATVYNCSTEQAVVCRHGHLDDKNNWRHVVLKFDDETGTLWWAFNSSSLLQPQHLQVLQKQVPGYDLVAASEDKVNGYIVGETTLQIGSLEEKTYGLTFLFSEPVRNDILSGKCQIEKPSNK